MQSTTAFALTKIWSRFDNGSLSIGVCSKGTIIFSPICASMTRVT